MITKSTSMGLLSKSLVVLLVLGLASCRTSGSNDLKIFIQEVKTRPKGNIEPLPTFKSYDIFTYAAASLRSPFEAPISVKLLQEIPEESNVKPDFNRPKEILENFSLSELAMVGTLAKRDGNLWALISDSQGNVHRVQPGYYMGKNHGRIIAIKDAAIDLIEIVPSGRGGWIERPRTVQLAEAP